MRESMTRKIAFSSGHRYWFSHLSDQENQVLFGKWGSQYNHGHNYILDVTVAGEVNEENGMIVNIKDIKAGGIIPFKEQVIEYEYSIS